MKHHIPHPTELLDAVRAHITKTSISKSAFGVLAVGDPGFVAGLEAGRECRSKTVLRVMEYMRTGKTFQQAKGEAL